MERGVRFGIDAGEVRVGVAVCDPDGLVAVPLTTEKRNGGEIRRIAKEIRERNAVAVYVGLPLLMSGEEGKAAKMARRFGTLIARAIDPIPVFLIDERLTSAQAHRALSEAGKKHGEHKAVVDQLAAAIILESALEMERSLGRFAGTRLIPPTKG